MPDKLNLAQLPTPIQKLPHLSRLASKWSDVRIYVKRDDLTHGAAAGNKIRKLEYLLAEAKRAGKKTVFTCGGIQSNHARATAVLCRELGLRCVLFLSAIGGKGPGTESVPQANLLLDRLVGAEIRIITPEQYENIAKVFLDAADEFREADGSTPLFIPEGGSNELGALGYVSAVTEIAGQLGKDGLPQRLSSIVVANGSGGTHAGLLMGVNLLEWDEHCRVISFNVSRTPEAMAERVKRVMLAAIQRNRLPLSVMPADIHVQGGYVGPGYAQADPELYDFIAEVARTDGLLLDPVYTGKAAFGLISELRASAERARPFGQDILFIHTGGLPSIFGHSKQLAAAISRAKTMALTALALALGGALAGALITGEAIAKTASPTPVAQASPKSGPRAKPQAIDKFMTEARDAMSEGKRKQAISLLDQARALAQAKAQIREIDTRRTLFSEQFFTAESFQRAQEAKELSSLERWEDCLKELAAVAKEDQDNLIILRLRSDCQMALKQYDDAARTFQSILGLIPGDLKATFGLVEGALLQKKPKQGLSILEGAVPKASADLERYAIMKARLLEQDGRVDEAIEILKQDQEAHIDHTEVLYELGMINARNGNDWPARKMLSLFLSRSRRMKEPELKAKGFDVLSPLAQAKLEELDKKLGVQP